MHKSLSKLPQPVKDKLHTLFRAAVGMDFQLVNPSKSGIWTYEGNSKYTQRLFHFEYLLKHVDQIDGRIVECGVGPGRSTFAFSIISQHITRSREIWGFDTFEGIPPPTVEDGKSNRHKAGWWNHPQQQVVELLQFNGIDPSFVSENITFVPGRFDESLSKYDGAPIALLHLDVDFYESYKVALESLYDYVAPGGTVAFDEYLNPTWPGATQAIDEFFADRPDEVVKSPVVDLYYVVKQDGRDEV